MEFIADLHVHSKYSRATAKNLDLENLYIAAQLKGVTVVGTGDFTYPAWFSEICEKLEPAEPGLFKLKKGYAKYCDQEIPRSCRNRVRFILSTEISNIYKKNNKTRKNHNLVLMPDLAAVEKFNAKLDNIGNIKSDGRPILGLDARNLLEILLETSEQGFLIPAHIWTPWFSLLGSKSGFDSVEECFEDLTTHIFAVETGLSSDPPMNWRVSGLDGLTLVSNSDAHSPMNVGREANLFNASLSFDDIKSALKSGDPDKFPATFEFYPEEGKYHLDGHRNCEVRLWPQKTKRYGGKCPVCGKGLTLGVLYRVQELADRRENEKPPKRPAYHSIIQLADILSEILMVGSNSKKVQKNYQAVLNQLGSEFDILHRLTMDDIEKAGIPLLAEAIRRMRHKEIDVLPGFDGEYGQVKIFKNQEREQLQGQKTLFSIPQAESSSQPAKSESPNTPQQDAAIINSSDPVNAPAAIDTGNPDTPVPAVQLNHDQRRAVEYSGGPLLIVAGPGTGKTRTLTHRIAYLINEKKVLPQHILAVAFTNKAAQEMGERLSALIGGSRKLPLVATFHALCFKILNEQKVKPSGIIDEDHRRALIAEAVRYVKAAGHQFALKPNKILNRIMDAKQQVLDPAEFATLNRNDPQDRIISNIYKVYQRLLAIQGYCDFEDLIFNVVKLLEAKAGQRRKYRDQFQHIFVDEYQDLNPAQYRIIRALVPEADAVRDLCVIGDPDQSIYGFRGSDVTLFNRFKNDYSNSAEIKLTRNYRSTETILSASFQVIKGHRIQSSDIRTYSELGGVKTISILELVNEKAEAECIARVIEQQIGGTGFHSIDTGTVKDANLAKPYSYSDFAVLYRTHDQHRAIAEIFEKRGIPFQIASRETVLDPAGLPELISYLKIIEGNGGFFDYDKILKIARPGLGKKALDQFKNWCFQNRFSLQEGLIKVNRFPIPGMASAKQQKLNDFSNHIEHYKTELTGLSVVDKLQFLQKKTKLSGMLSNDVNTQEAFVRLLDYADRFNGNTTDFFAATALHTDTDTYAPAVEKVSLMTMHASKGLEFPVVFIAGCEETLIPYRRPDREENDIRQERRLFYVAMTRAMERLYLTHAKKRRIHGRHFDRNLSQFVEDIEKQLKIDESPVLKKKKNDKQQPVQMKLF
ncbi:Endonuclease Q, cleaves 5' to damaged DNA bases / ATP-dependent DNA helicase UvrD/PcrA-like protein [Olavius sp. associated proteobacterium Delta 1]|nr:Endonuclease Q, cleaves 5' to damaged DNA bases / ATP-dependent DNA helicase UvrD/PcrA-like protein [Olavius sp. associated proteobacterium Delta 1]